MSISRLIQTTTRLNLLQRKLSRQNLWNSLQNAARTSCSCLHGLPIRHFHSSRQRQRELREYDEVFKKSIEEPEEFWAELAEEINWYKPFTKVLDNSNQPFTKWFVGGEMNTCYNCLDRHIENGRGKRIALIYDSPLNGKVEMYTYENLQRLVAKFAGALAQLNVGKGDRVVIYMPMIPQAVIAMLACARLGAIHSVVFGGFAAQELARRIEHAEPRVVVTASCGLEPSRLVYYKPLLDEAIRLSKFKPSTCVVYQRDQCSGGIIPGQDISWDQLMEKAQPHDCVPVLSTDPLYILYTSGTTGDPKGIVRPNGGHAVALNWSMRNLYGINPGEVWWAASDLGWVVGHSYIVYAPLLSGCTTVLFEGKPVGTPDAGAFFRVIEQHKVVSMFTAPTAIRIIRAEDPNCELIKEYDLSHFRGLFVAGEHLDKDTMQWARRAISAPVYDNWWQTETGWAITAHAVGLGRPMDEHLQTTGKPVPGYNVKILKDGLTEADRGDLGQVVVKLPLPPGTMATLWKADDRFVKTYFTKYPGYYDSSDDGVMDDGGFVSIMARTDDVINVAGHRISTKSLEEGMIRLDFVIDAACVGLEDPIKGHLPVGFIVIDKTSGVSREDAVQQVIQSVREFVGPVAAFKTAIVVPTLPKTRSGKTVRGVLSKILHGKPYKITPTMENPHVLEDIETIVREEGIIERTQK
ncbi:acyl-CoA synthetase short-chain family member 3, mitochondrial-like [Pocillopora damicornis]|uniref:acyl-CoA synthetase short-chain family member 3, mitochondrial-like n=1 Tax=Pocillopora damicornis TaxID=46731 RepID=UPI000F55340E|nr:acyl-CoA synthetase short-chain family member 3, mitochondrial-like [Pocillopora damicornis]